ncbi:hypothetical protein LEN26_006974 [Aphanomyces euteiches]|nr:hypothetical protein AeMF1_020372 [Aphanomyces euteiches]KAH9133836.1 hypothetical protein LEN26_006974 [Aphanomyces euteiches]KAH9195282.1 hypothetical protein AeNC1_002734 [Aphanomyces euteiches]
MSNGWKCIAQPSNGAVTAVQLNMDDEIQCLGFDANSCVFFHSMEDCHNNLSPSLDVKPLPCGAKHKNVYGITGYEDASHWCATGRKHLGNLSFVAKVQAKKYELGIGAVVVCMLAFVALLVVRKTRNSGYQRL